MTRGMELRQLRYFVGVARELNFTRAAARLHVAQPALSRQIRQLEDEVGVELLARGARGVRLTAAGEAFLREAETVLRQSELAVEAAQQSDRQQRGELNVGYVWGLFHTLVPQWVARFRQTHPGVAINLFDLSATALAASLAAEKLDLGFVGFAYEADSVRLSKQRVAHCEFQLALPKAHPAVRRKRADLAAFAGEFFITVSDQSYPGAAQLVNAACEAAGFRPKILQSAERGFGALSMVAAGCGVALLPESLRELPHPGVEFRPLANPVRAELFVAWKAARGSALQKAFLQFLAETCPAD